MGEYTPRAATLPVFVSWPAHHHMTGVIAISELASALIRTRLAPARSYCGGPTRHTFYGDEVPASELRCQSLRALFAGDSYCWAVETHV